LAYLLVNRGPFAEARAMAQRIQAAASSSAEKEVANNLLVNIQQAEEWSPKKQSQENASLPGKRFLCGELHGERHHHRPQLEPKIHWHFRVRNPVGSTDPPVLP